MKEPQEFIPDEDLQRFFLTGTLFLNLSEELEQQEYNRLRMVVQATQKCTRPIVSSLSM